MSRITNAGSITAAAMAALLLAVPDCYARENILAAGLATSLDYSDRTYSSIPDDPDTPENESTINVGSDEDYQRIVITPMVHIKSSSPRDTLELRAAPGIKYDLEDSGTDWDSNLYVAADRFMTRSWQLRISDSFLRSDYHDPETYILIDPVDPAAVAVEPSEPQLSADAGRTRYWRNSLDLSSEHTYREESLVRLGFSYIVLRNDDDAGSGGYDDYDRYEASLRNEHRFNARWGTALDFRYIRGDFEPTDQEIAVIDAVESGLGVTIPEDALSDDLDEYRLLLAVTNESIDRNPLSLAYNYIGSRYDEPLQDNSDIHQMRLTWRRDYSPRLYTNLGIGPSYEKTEGQDGTWDTNGIAEVNYLVERGSFNFLVEKRFDVDNFSGTNERGIVDVWNTSFTVNYDLRRDLALTGLLAYIYEDREDRGVGVARALTTEDPLAALEDENFAELEKIHQDSYVAQIGLTYSFWQFYAAALNYTFTKQESDDIRDEYDDHRLLLTLSWEKDLFRW